MAHLIRSAEHEFMQMKPSEFLETFVEGNLFDFEDDPSSVRKGINAAVAAFHMADHFHAFYARHGKDRVVAYGTRDEFLKHLASRCPLFLDVQSVANVYKHLYLDTQKAHIMVGSAGAIDVVGDGDSSVERDLNEATKDLTVVYQIKTGEKRPLLPAVQAVVSMWGEFLRDADPAIRDNAAQRPS